MRKEKLRRKDGRNVFSAVATFVLKRRMCKAEKKPRCFPWTAIACKSQGMENIVEFAEQIHE